MLWWRWSALVASAIGGLELLYLAVAAVALGEAEFAAVAVPFVAFALLAAWVADPLVMLLWMLFARRVAALRTRRGWLVLFVLALAFPLFMAPRSGYEFAVAAPSLLGLLLPRFVVRRLAVIPPRAC